MAAFQPASADPERPTGPAATEAPAPTLKWPNMSWSMPCWFITIITRSLLWPPICQPMLPPEMSNGAGALHPELVRQEASPLPCSPPTMNAPLIMWGITAMHLAPVRTESGMPALPVVICWMISEAWLTLVAAASLSCAQPRDARAKTHRIDAIFMVTLLPALFWNRGGERRVGPRRTPPSCRRAEYNHPSPAISVVWS